MLLALSALLSGYLFAQQRVITGKVTDADGKPLAGAAVAAKGASTGFITGEDGLYRLPVAANVKSLIVSSVGYGSQELVIGNNTNLNFSLRISADNLDEVVVVGYQSVKRKDLNGAVAVIGSKELAQKPISNFTQLLQGKAPGLQVVGQSGQPGQNGYLRVRGTGSINASSEPLIMVDGIAVTSTAFGLINPNDIENVTVLKDASAAALYGARAGNGVLVVTTKKGKQGKPQLRYSYQRGFVSLQNLPNLRFMNSGEKLQYEYDARVVNPIVDSMIANRIAAGQLAAGSTLFTISADQRAALWELAASRGAGDWRNYYLQKGKTEQHELSLSGASDKIRYYFSMNKFDEDGLLYKSFRNRLGGRMNVEYQALDWFKTGVNAAVTTTNEYQNRELNNVQSPWKGVFTTNPYEPVYMPDGTYNLTFQGFSPLEGQDLNPTSVNRISSFATLFAEAKFFRNLIIKSQVALNYNTMKYENYLQAGSNLAAILGYNEKADAGNQDFQYVSTNTANWAQSLRGNHNIDILFGQEFTKRSLYSYSLAGRGMPTPSVNTIDNAATAQTASTSKSDWSIVSYFANLGYDYNKTYGIRLSARRDGSSRFGANNRYSNFWAVSGWWNTKKEAFLSDIHFLSDLKLRASLGTSGNVPNELYGSLGTYALNAAYNNLPAAAPAQLANPNLTWEKNKNFDIGIDFGFLENRITGTVDYYNRKTSDLLYPKNVSLGTGFSSVLSNIGGVTNKGFEVSLSGDIIRKKELSWNVTLTYTSNDNKVNELVSDNTPSTTFTRLKIGQPLNTFYMVRWAGINPTNGKNQFYKADGSTTETYSLNDAVLLEGKSPLAKFYGSVNSTVTYKSFDLSLQFYYTGGNYTYNNMYQNGVGDGANASAALTIQFTDVNDYWRKAGDVTRYPSITDPTQKTDLTTDKFLEKADYLTLRDVVIGYNLPASVAKKIKLAGARFYVQATNLWINTRFHGSPEVGFSNREAAGAAAPNFSQPGQFNLYAYPQSKAITVGLDIRF